jgi:capsular polysaccharide transport system permease protein
MSRESFTQRTSLLATPRLSSAVAAVGRAAGAVVGRRGAEPAAEGRVRAPRAWPSAYLLSLIAVVVIPSLLIQFYLAFLATDQFVAETRFTVRESQPGAGGGGIKAALSALGSAGGLQTPSSAGQEPYVVTSYIHSRAMIDDIGRSIDLAAVFRRPEADFWARLKTSPSAEDMLDYWNGMVATNVDPLSGFVTVEARAFRPEDALAIAQQINLLSENLANDMSARAREDIMSRAEAEARRSEAMVLDALTAMREFREKEGYLSPLAAAETISKLLMQSIGDKIAVENELFVSQKSLSPDAPTLQSLKSRLRADDAQIDRLKSQLTQTSSQGEALSASLAKYEELDLRRAFAEKLYAMAQDLYERARASAESRQIYVSVFVPPSLPQESRFPRRLALSLLCPLGLLVVWGIFALLAAAVEDHRI